MSTTLRLAVIALLAACVHPTGPLDRFRGATGGDRWDRVHVIAGDGAIDVGGMSGTIATVEDVATGRSRTTIDLGAMRIASGDDGRGAWEQAPGGEVVIADAPEAVADARTAAWLTRRGYFQAAGAAYRPLGAADGAHGVEATPAGGAPIELWFDDGTGLLARTRQARGADTIVTTYDDYRDVDGVRLPFRVVTDDGDPRNRVTITYARLALEDAVADAAFARPATDAERLAFVGDVRATDVAFELINHHIYVDAEVDGQPVRMLVDTGGLNMLTPAAAARLGLETAGKLAAGGVGAEKVDLSLAHAGSLQLGAVRLAEPVFYVIDIGALADVEGEDFDGLVGFELFARLAVRIDYPGRRLTLSRPEDFVAPAGAVAVPFELRDRTPIVDGEIDGLPARLAIDTGARNSLTATAPFTAAHDLAKRYRPRFETVTGWGVGGPVRSSPVRFGEVKLGAAVVRDVAGDLFTGDKGAMADPDESGNVGGGILARFVVTFDYAGRTMYLQPADPPPPRDVYDRAGMFLLRDGDALKVVAVTPGGPAEHAGLQPDDRVVAIDGDAASSRHLAAWRTVLAEGAVGAKHVLAVERAGAARRDVTLVLAEQLP